MSLYPIIQKSELKGALRLDSEYYQPEYLGVEEKLASVRTKSIDKISKSVVNFGAYSLCNYIRWQRKGIPYLNVQNIKDGYIDFDDVKFINGEVNKILEKSQVREGQVILTMAGTIGNAAVAHEIPEEVNSNQATAKITLKDGFSPYYLCAFLNCYYGKKQTEREIVSSVQPNIFLFQIKNFKVPLISNNYQKEIEKIYKKGLNKLENSKSLYLQAEDFLLGKLGLKDFEVGNDLSYIISLSKTESAHRLDAEYFQPKYDKLVGKIKSKNVKSVGEIVSMKKGIEPGAESYQDEGRAFIRVSSLSKYGVEDKDQKYLSEELYQKLKNNHEPKIGEILLTKDATPGIAYVMKEEVEGIISSGILRLKAKDKEIEKEYLALCLNSIVGRMQAERDGGGSIITHWRPAQIKDVLIPILPISDQKKISKLVEESHEARKNAKQLLGQAKQKVEELIQNKSR